MTDINRRPDAEMTPERIWENRLRILSNLYDTPVLAEAVARRIRDEGDL